MSDLKKIGLCMIVRNEAHIIRRCLASARPLIDYALIVDTGSDDATVHEIQSFLAEEAIPGEVVEEPWRDFAYNRSHALAEMRARSDIDYALMIDADDRIELLSSRDAGAIKSTLRADVYNLWTRLGGHAYVRPQLISNRKSFGFKGILHEYLVCEEAFSQAALDTLVVHAVQDSARNRDQEKYRKDARTLIEALATETDAFLRSRYTFYLAQSYRDCGDHAEALKRYLERAEQGFWDQEVYVSLLNAAQMAERLERPTAEALDLYLKAYDLCPWRVEALHGAARHCRIKSKFQSGYLFAERGLEIALPRDGLFLAEWIYRYGMLDEYAVLAYWCGRYGESREACRKLLAIGEVPAADRSRIAENAKFAEVALNESS